MAGVSSGPTPWWQLPEYNKAGPTGHESNLTNLEQSAPAGYEYDPVQMQYVRTPTAAGQRVNQFETAAIGDMLNGMPSMQGLSGSASGMASGAGGGVTTAGAGIAPGAQVPGVQAPDMTASNAATFAAAKDRVGKLGRASIDSLAGELGAQNMLGSGAQVQGTRDIISGAMGQLGDVERTNAVNEAGQKADFAKLGYTGAITQRGQDIAAQEAAARLAEQQNESQARLQMEARAQQLQQLQMILSGLGGASSAIL